MRQKFQSIHKKILSLLLTAALLPASALTASAASSDFVIDASGLTITVHYNSYTPCKLATDNSHAALSAARYPLRAGPDQRRVRHPVRRKLHRHQGAVRHLYPAGAGLHQRHGLPVEQSRRRAALLHSVRKGGVACRQSLWHEGRTFIHRLRHV